MKLVWTKQLSVGNAVIDSDHKNLIAIINGIQRVISEKEHSAVSLTFEFLEGWLCVHFNNEERIAQAAYLDFSHYKQAQDYSLKKLQYLRDELISKNGIWSDSAIRYYSHCLMLWMNEHINRVDMPMKPGLQTLGYPFWPGHGKSETNFIAGRTASLYPQPLDTPTPCYA